MVGTDNCRRCSRTGDHQRLRVRAGRSGAARSAAAFNGRNAYLEAPAAVAKAMAKGDFSIAAWIHPDSDETDVHGDIVSQYDSKRRRGFHLTLKTNTGVARFIFVSLLRQLSLAVNASPSLEIK